MSKVSLGKGSAIAETAQALRVKLSVDGGPSRWIPKSVLHDDSEVYENGHEGDVVVAEWWADKEGLSDIGKGTKR